ncbi:FAD/NAD(P)-binding domain-containing protein [Setomelanomma holmii]|uniref:FAD/NAD(P)-binding domain-containing protein n=1 Tax=Setomelanomma holmii TaxID=210430 RepID=A0A9P4GYX2_9PLEO|nr:FAD/NAD(P)-binding domain-containing protein [Setomelanomma holmii]
MSRLSILIAGNSIAGPITAYFLSRAGHTVTVIERYPSLHASGQAVDIRTCGVSVMRHIPGMETAVRAKSTQEEGVSFMRDDGRSWGVIRATGSAEQQGIVSEFEIFRGDLAQILSDLTKDDRNVKHVFDEQIVSISQSDKSIRVEFAKRKQPEGYDLVVACDGATSRTRAMGFECGVREHIVSTNSWAAYFSTKQDLLAGTRVGQGCSAPGGRFVSIGSDPAGGNRVLLQCVNSPDGTRAFRKALAKGDEELKRYIAQHYRGAGWKTDLLMQEMMESEDLYASEIVQVKMPTLSKGRFVLVGDAGYAAGPTGGGTSLAMAGGYLLAGEISKHPGDLAAGLRGYEEQMSPLIQEMQKIPPLVSTIMAPQTAGGIWLRNRIFALVAWSGIAEWVQKYLGAAFADSSEFPLPDYDWAR